MRLGTSRLASAGPKRLHGPALTLSFDPKSGIIYGQRRLRNYIRTRGLEGTGIEVRPGVLPGSWAEADRWAGADSSAEVDSWAGVGLEA